MKLCKVFAWISAAALAGCGDDGAGGGGGDGGGIESESESEAESEGFESEAESEGGPICRKIGRGTGPAVVADDFAALVFAGLDVKELAGDINPNDLLFGFELLSLDDSTGQNDEAVNTAFEVLADPDPDDDNFSGKAPLCIDPNALDADDEPTVVLATAIAGGALHGETDEMEFNFNVMGLPISLTVHAVVLDAVVQADVAAWNQDCALGKAGPENCAHLEGQLWTSELAALDIIGFNMLEAIACGFMGLIPPTQPNIDVDGDGLETITCEMEGGPIVSCTDGDGTVIEGDDCGSELQDAYDFIMDFSAISFVIQGVFNG